MMEMKIKLSLMVWKATQYGEELLWGMYCGWRQWGITWKKSNEDDGYVNKCEIVYDEVGKDDEYLDYEEFWDISDFSSNEMLQDSHSSGGKRNEDGL